MKLHELQAIEGSRSKDYRRGRGIGSGNGKTAGKGHVISFVHLLKLFSVPLFLGTKFLHGLVALEVV